MRLRRGHTFLTKPKPNCFILNINLAFNFYVYFLSGQQKGDKIMHKRLQEVGEIYRGNYGT